MSYLAELRDHAQNQKRAAPPSVESIKTTEKPPLILLILPPPALFSFHDPFPAPVTRLQLGCRPPRPRWLSPSASG